MRLWEDPQAVGGGATGLEVFHVPGGLRGMFRMCTSIHLGGARERPEYVTELLLHSVVLSEGGGTSRKHSQ